MDERKTTQALKQIFDQCGTGILKERNRFKAYLEDLLPGGTCASERKLLLHALDSDALPVLLRQPAFTEGSARQAVEMLQNDIYVSEEAAQFVVRCVIAARSGEARLANKPAPRQTTPTPPKPAPIPSTPVPPSPPRPATAPVPSQPTAPRPNPPAPTVSCTLWCAPIKPKSKDLRIANKGQQPGEVQMLRDRLIFTPSSTQERTEITYHDIAKIKMASKSLVGAKMLKYFGLIDLLTVIIAGACFISALGEEGVIVTACILGILVLESIIGIAWWNHTGTEQISVQSGKQQYLFKIKNQRQSEQMYAVLQQGIHQNP